MDVQVLVHSKFVLGVLTGSSTSCFLSLAPDCLQYQQEIESLALEQVCHVRG